MKKYHRFFALFFFLTFLLVGAFFGNSAEAAVFNITPQSSSFNSGSRFSVAVSIDSQGLPINAAEGKLIFDPRYLSVESVSTDVSIFKFWAEEPAFSNAAGSISFTGGLPSPGYTGGGGKIFTIIFKALGAGESFLRFSSGAILANDGKGTNVFASSDEARYVIKADTISPSLEVESVNLPPSPVVSSVTHPEESVWYSSSDFRAAWNLAAGVGGVSYALFNRADYSLPRSSKGLVSEAFYDLEELGDGVWYFFARFHSSAGWGPVTRRVVRVDRTPPEPFTVSRIDEDDITNPQPLVDFSAEDAVSDISHYEVVVDSLEPFEVLPNDEQPIALPLLLPGDKKMLVKAYDAAGNYSEAEAVIEVLPIEAPVITDYSEKFSLPDSPFFVRGAAPPGYTVLVSLDSDDNSYAFESMSGEDGTWEFTSYDRIASGEYVLRVKSRDLRGASSLPTDGLSVKVSGFRFGVTEFMKRYGAWVLVVILLLSNIVFADLLVKARKPKRRSRGREKKKKK